jgi:hypothetical protein
MRPMIMIALLLTATPLAAAAPPSNPLIDYQAYLDLAREVAPLRAKRLLTLDAFRAKAGKRGALILDARSADAFAEGHIAGAVNLPFTDFTAESLASVIGPDRDRPILIYCNNNFRNNVRPVALKMTPRAATLGRGSPVALNVQTFVNLVGYGYANVWELGEAVDMNDSRVGWVSASRPARPAAP